MTPPSQSIIGSLHGTAVGDALGLACEGMSRRRRRKVFGEPDGYHFILNKGMVSDDTEHACMTAQALIVSAGEPDRFARSLGWRLRFWMLGLPAGIGLATLRAIIKLWVGFPPSRSGVFSAGNGPAMRSPIIGVCFGHDPGKMRDLVRACTRITHTDPKAEYGALAVALAAHMAAEAGDIKVKPADFLDRLRLIIAGDGAEEFIELMNITAASAEAGNSTEAFVDGMGLAKGVTGYMYHTVPAVIHAWLVNQGDFQAGIKEIISLGGDTDTTAAILGGIMGAGAGKDGIPKEWLDDLWEWPRSVIWIERLGKRLTEVIVQEKPQKAQPLPIWGVLIRNILFMIIVLAHGFRRLLPPY